MKIKCSDLEAKKASFLSTYDCLKANINNSTLVSDRNNQLLALCDEMSEIREVFDSFCLDKKIRICSCNDNVLHYKFFAEKLKKRNFCAVDNSQIQIMLQQALESLNDGYCSPFSKITAELLGEVKKSFSTLSNFKFDEFLIFNLEQLDRMIDADIKMLGQVLLLIIFWIPNGFIAVNKWHPN